VIPSETPPPDRTPLPPVAPGTAQAAPPHARTGLLAAALVAGAITIVLAGVDSELYDLERYLAPKALALHLTALASLLILLPSWRRIELGITAALLAAFVLWTILSAALATNRWLALHGAGITVSGFVLYLAARRVAEDGLAPRVIGGLAAAAVLAGGLGIAQAYGAEWPLLADSRPPGGTFGNRNFLAHLTAIATPLLAWVLLRGRAASTVLAFLGLVVAAGTIVLTRSRAAWLGTAVAMLTMIGCAWLGRRTVAEAVSPRRMMLIGAALAAGAAAAILLPNRLQWRSDSPYAETFTTIARYSEGSGRGRLIQYGNSVALVADAPVFGVGPGNWFVHYPRVTSRGDPAFDRDDPIPTNPWPSSDWVAFLVERGPVGVLFLIAAGATAAITCLRRLRGDPLRALAAIALLGTLAAAAITGAFDAVLLLAAPTFFVFTSLGLLLPGTRPVVVRALPPRATRVLGLAAVAAVVLLIVAATGQVAAIAIAGDGSSRARLQTAARFDPGGHRLRLLLARRGGCSVRLPHARAAYRLMPYHDAPERALRACGERPPD
jgi:O-antigen ligase